MTVLVTCSGRHTDLRRASAGARRYAERMLRALDMQGVELSLLVCDDLRMRQLNREHRRMDKPTDVLSFSMREGPPVASPGALLGDIAIALPTAVRQAKAHGWPVRVEVCLLLAHGLLHLLGFDHRNRTEERRMMARAHLLMMAALPRPARVDKRSRLAF